MRFVDEHRVFTHRHRSASDGKNIYVLGPWRISEQRVSRGNNNDVRFDHRGYGTHSCGGVRAREYVIGTRISLLRRMLPRRWRANLLPMNNHGYPVIWSAKLITLTQLQVAAIEPVNVVMRVVYNTLDGIVNDYFVITASVAKR
jgi:hypothetical protein